MFVILTAAPFAVRRISTQKPSTNIEHPDIRATLFSQPPSVYNPTHEPSHIY
jgi:hypothetical protein